MKKTLLMVAIVGLAMASCKKAKTCTCTMVSTSSTGIVTTEQPKVTAYTKISSGDAKNQCVTTSKSNTIVYAGTTQTTSDVNTCTLN